jgi:transposase
VIVAGSWNKPEQSPEPYAAQAVVELGFARKLLARLPIRGTCLVVVEATGGYERLLIAELTSAGHYVARVNPRQARNFVKALGVLAKTDRLDASVLAKFARDVRPRCLAEAQEKQGELEQLVSRRRQLIDQRTAEKTARKPPRSSSCARISSKALIV